MGSYLLLTPNCVFLTKMLSSREHAELRSTDSWGNANQNHTEWAQHKLIFAALWKWGITSSWPARATEGVQG